MSVVTVTNKSPRARAGARQKNEFVEIVSWIKTKETFDPQIKTIRQFLRAEFGKEPQESWSVMAPALGSYIEVKKPLQTAHESSGSGLDNNHCIPVGKYRVNRFDYPPAGGNSVWLSLISVEKPSREVSFCCGYRNISSVAWCKEAVKAIKPVKKIEEMLDLANPRISLPSGYIHRLIENNKARRQK